MPHRKGIKPKSVLRRGRTGAKKGVSWVDEKGQALAVVHEYNVSNAIRNMSAGGWGRPFCALSENVPCSTSRPAPPSHAWPVFSTRSNNPPGRP